MARLVLHIGSHKTGTTALQSALKRSGEALAPQNAAVANARFGERLLVQTTGTEDSFRATLREKMADKLFRPQADTTIISEELLFWLDDEASIATLSQIIRDRFDDVSIVAYLRRQDQIVLSHRKQVALGRAAQLFYGADFLRLPKLQPHLMRYLDYHAKLVGLWAAHFGPEAMIVVPYERERLVDQDIVADFSHRIGFQLGPQKADKNLPLSGAQLVSGFALAGLGLSIEQMKSVLAAVDQAMAGDQHRLLPTRAEAQEFMAAFAGSNARLAETFRIDGKPLEFSASFDSYPETHQPEWTSEEVRTLIRCLVSLPQIRP